MADNYEKNYESLRPRLQSLDVDAVSANLGLAAPVDGCLHIDLLHRHYRIDQSGVYDEGGEGLANVNCKSVLIWYLTHGGSGEPHHRFQPLQALCPSPIAGSGSDANWQAAEIERIFGQAEQKVSPTMTAFGAQAVESGSSADATWRLMALPKMPMELRYYRADEEFPCSVDILVDQTAMTFLPFEALGELVGYIYEELAHIAKSL